MKLSKKARAELIAEKKCREAKKGCFTFIEKYVHIEDRDSPELAVPFLLWEKQKAALEMIIHNRLMIILKARQLGLTWLALAYAVWRMIFTPGFAVVALSKREEDAKELTRRVTFILRYLPRWMIRQKEKGSMFAGPMWDSTTMTVIITHPDGEPSVFTSMSAGPDSGRSFTANLVILDEWAFQQWAEEIWSAAYPTINRPTGGQVIGLSTAKRGTLFEEIWKKAVAGENTFTPIFLPWNTDPRRTQEWYEQTIKDLPRSYMAEYPATPEEAFSAGEGTAFPEFSREIHVCQPFAIPKHWKRFASCDNGYRDPFAWYWYAVSEDGQVFVYREYTRNREDEPVYYTDQGAEFMVRSTYKEIDEETGDVKDKTEDIGYIVAGLDAWNTHHRDQSGKSLIDYYRDGGIEYGFIKAVTDRVLRKATLHEYLKPYELPDGTKTAKLQIFSTCKGLIEQLPQLLVDEKDPEKVADGDDDRYDSLSYGLISYHTEKSKPPKAEEPPIAKRKNALAKRVTQQRRKLS